MKQPYTVLSKRLLAAVVLMICAVASLQAQDRRLTSFGSPYPTKSSAILRPERVVPDVLPYYENDLYTFWQDPVSNVGIGDTLTKKLYFQANRDIANVHIQDLITPNFEFVKSEPEAKLVDGRPVWQRSHMDAGELQEIVVTYRAKASGAYKTCMVAKADPRLCAVGEVGVAALSITKSGPAASELGDTVTWNVTVTNTGSALAKNVTVNDTLPDRFKGADLKRSLGDLKPGESRNLQFVATSGAEGKFTNRAEATYEGAAKAVAATADIVIRKSAVGIEKTGPVESFVLNEVVYNIVVKNTGSATLNNVVVTDTVPAGLRVVDQAAGTIRDNTVVWNVGTLEAGKSQTFALKVVGTQPGKTTNTVNVTTANGVAANASATTEWIAYPGLHTVIIDSKDPVRVGDSLVFTCSILNQGDFKPVDGKVVVKFPEALKPLAIEGATGTVEGRLVTLPKILIQPGKDIVFRVQAKAEKAGYAITVMEVQPSFLPEEQKIISQQSTTIY